MRTTLTKNDNLIIGGGGRNYWGGGRMVDIAFKEYPPPNYFALKSMLFSTIDIFCTNITFENRKWPD